MSFRGVPWNRRPISIQVSVTARSNLTDDVNNLNFYSSKHPDSGLQMDYDFSNKSGLGTAVQVAIAFGAIPRVLDLLRLQTDILDIVFRYNRPDRTRATSLSVATDGSTMFGHLVAVQHFAVYKFNERTWRYWVVGFSTDLVSTSHFSCSK
ncbi:hypothetical protein K504DRAFT_462858 [Pleomassaria siparia CBS 279.74]|uniref:Uncharacterized protein n=1 Tax=Pleomassaria siparia CBS 279.74 TaxID=1314801 RepID=A0A6G1JUK6_9PLEO|nr:hypothetical protein K504DRAFT_462858 [Pleomassaria siparia CBS 279.74]